MRYYPIPEGVGEVTVWLQELNQGMITTLPLWYAAEDNLVVGLLWPNEDDIPQLLVAESREDMVSGIQPHCLWFCKVPKDEFLYYMT